MLAAAMFPPNPSSAIKQGSQLCKEREDWDFCWLCGVFLLLLFEFVLYLQK